METNKQGEWFEIVIPEKWEGVTIESLLKDVWKTPKKLLHQFRMNKDTTVNGEQLSWSTMLKAKDRFRVRLFPSEEFGVIPDKLDMQIIYEDDHVLVVNKPAGVDTHPNEDGQTGTLANGVAFYYMENGVETKVRHIHRLDRETSGAILFAKHALAGAVMDRQLEKRNISRTYLALVHGQIKREQGIIDFPIGKDRHHPNRRRVSPGGQRAVTEYQVVRYDKKQHVSVVKLDLQTGRTHQIRVHMHHQGHPIAGDKLYEKQNDGYARLALHAAKISFLHPITEERISASAVSSDRLPEILKQELNKI
ncbi:RluA family pseudouridine synthase [Thalassobacillus devorans]|uniref:RluA family pseudouridine synthase n=1 Tax=Thalassobacillus devorans TaxID=279813 RepID=UPI00048CD95E|nr:RluA family pseudouridine synthase [Thalassobacillus devorans]